MEFGIAVFVSFGETKTGEQGKYFEATTRISTNSTHL